MPQDIIEPRVLKGFRDFLPAQEAKRRDFTRRVEDAFLARGFVPIDTPALEYAEILLGKGGGETEKQIYRFKDHGDRDVALRFDLTVPFARFMAAHYHELYLPFRRYHIGKVWRGENTQRGRYREFCQCDCDIVGADSPGSDFEILSSMAAALEALGLGAFSIRVSHRGAFNLFLEGLGVKERSAEVLRIADKLRKIGPEETTSLLAAAIGAGPAERVKSFIGITGGIGEGVREMEALLGGECPATARLKEIEALAAETGIGKKIVLDASITRGLDYYTGIVFETYLDAMPGIGSVCSGGRYDDLASLYTKERIPGVGASIGMDRLLAALEEIGGEGETKSFVKALLVCADLRHLGQAFALAERLRGSETPVEVFTERKKIQQAFAYAEKKSISRAVILDEEYLRAGRYIIRDMRTRENSEASDFDGLVASLGRP
jgi:histidyl-tRNA synthetase